MPRATSKPSATSSTKTKDTNLTKTMDQVHLDEPLGRNRRVILKTYNGTTLLHLRLYDDEGHPTKKGICLPIELVKVLMDITPQALQAIEEGIETTLHISNSIRLQVSDFGNADIRLYWYPPDGAEQVPTKKGVNLRSEEFKNLVDVLDLYSYLF